MLRPREDRLFARFRVRRDARALGAAFDRTAPALLRVALHLTGRTADAEDALQQTFLTAIERAAAWDAERGLFPWLVGILTNHVRNSRRANARTVDPARLAPPAGDDPIAAAERAELGAAIARAVAELGDVYGPVLRLHLEHGFDAAEIARVLDRPPGTVRTQLVRGLERLRRALAVGLGAGAVLALGSGRGLAAVRTHVLEVARATGAATGAGIGGAAMLAGGAMGMGAMGVKKVVILVPAALLLLLGGWQWLALAGPQPVVAIERGALPASAELASAAAAAAPPPAGAPELERAEVAPVAPAAATGRLRVRIDARLPGATATEPLPGAIVLATPNVLPTTIDGTDPELRSTIADADGIAELEVEPGVWAASVRSGGFSTAAARVVRVDAGQVVEAVVTFAMERVVRGRVVDPQGAPVVGAEIWLGFGGIGRSSAPQILARRAGTSGPDGSFRVLDEGPLGTVVARKTGWCESATQSSARPGLLVLSLRDGAATLAGEVVDAAGAPVESALVTIRQGAEGTTQQRVVRTDRSGRFAAIGLAAGAFGCEVLVHGTVLEALSGELAANARTDVRVVLRPAVRVVGRCVRDGGGTFDDVTVVVVDAGDKVRFRSSTNGDGTFTTSWVPFGALRVQARRDERVLAEQTFTPPFAQRELACALRLDDPPSLAGVVTGPDGAPLAGWLVTAGPATTLARRVDERGAFTFHGLGAGVFDVAVFAPRGDRERPTLVRAAVPAGTLDLRLEVPATSLPTARLRARIVDAAGHPLANATAILRRLHGDSRPPELLRFARADEIRLENGELAAAHLIAGDYFLDVRAPGRASRRVALALAANAPADLGDVVLAAAAGLRVRPRLADGSAWPAQRQPPRLQLRSADGGPLDPYPQLTADGETIVCDGLAAGRVLLRSADGVIAAPLVVEVHTGITTAVDWPVAIGHERVLTFARDANARNATAGTAANGTAANGATLRVVVHDAATGWRLERDLTLEPSSLPATAPIVGRAVDDGVARWTLAHTFPAGRFTIDATASSGERYRGALTITDDAPVATAHVDVPRAR